MRPEGAARPHPPPLHCGNRRRARGLADEQCRGHPRRRHGPRRAAREPLESGSAGYGAAMPDICDIILEEHGYFRAAFTDLYAARDRGPEALASRWDPLAAVFERHAAAEEEIFYPALLPRGEDAVEETEDAIKDHNAIRAAVKSSAGREIGSDEWWEAVERARDENDEHMVEEETEGIPDFRAHSEPSLREELGDRFLAFNAAHPCAEGLDLSEKDPDEYIEDHGGGEDPVNS